MEQGARNRNPLLLSAGNLDPAFADLRVESVIRSQKQSLGCLAQDSETLLVGRIRPDELQVLTNRPRKELRILRDKSQAFSQVVDLDLTFRRSVV